MKYSLGRLCCMLSSFLASQWSDFNSRFPSSGWAGSECQIRSTGYNLCPEPIKGTRRPGYDAAMNDRSDPAALYQQARISCQQGRLAEGAALARRALAIDPSPA